MEEVKKQVRIAMASNETELQELRQQNEFLRRAVQASSRPLGEDEGPGVRTSVERSRGGVGIEPAPNLVTQRFETPDLQGDPRPLYERAGISGRTPLSAGGPQSVPAGELGGRCDRSVLDGRRLGDQDQSPDRQPGPAQPATADNGAVKDEPLHLLAGAGDEAASASLPRENRLQGYGAQRINRDPHYARLWDRGFGSLCRLAV